MSDPIKPLVFQDFIEDHRLIGDGLDFAFGTINGEMFFLALARDDDGTERPVAGLGGALAVKLNHNVAEAAETEREIAAFIAGWRNGVAYNQLIEDCSEPTDEERERMN
jgi:hypothetical protein